MSEVTYNGNVISEEGIKRKRKQWPSTCVIGTKEVQPRQDKGAEELENTKLVQGHPKISQFRRVLLKAVQRIQPFKDF